MAEIYGSGTSSISVSRTSKGDYTWEIKIYFIGNKYRDLKEVADRVLKLRNYVEVALGQQEQMHGVPPMPGGLPDAPQGPIPMGNAEAGGIFFSPDEYQAMLDLGARIWAQAKMDAEQAKAEAEAKAKAEASKSPDERLESAKEKALEEKEEKKKQAKPKKAKEGQESA